MEEFGISAADASAAVNDPHQYYRDDLATRIVVLHWFEDGRLYFVDASTKEMKHDPERRQSRIVKVQAAVVLEIGAMDRAGEISREMDAETILAIVAEKFGLPVRCDPSEPFSTLYTGRYHVRPDNNVALDVMNTGNAGKVQLAGIFNPKTNWCDRVWAFNIEGYRRWWADNK
jgi:hypothetical protein